MCGGLCGGVVRVGCADLWGVVREVVRESGASRFESAFKPEFIVKTMDDNFVLRKTYN